MDKIKKILVGLDFSASDKTILKHVKTFNQIFNPERIIFVNIHPQVSLPEDISSKYPDLIEEIDKRYIEELINEITPLHLYRAETECRALEGDPLTTILHLIKQESIDLVVLGKKKEVNQTHLTHKKLTRKSACHVLVIPDNAKPNYEKILVATDFSEDSGIAVDMGTAISLKTKSELICEHIYEVPTGYYKTGKSYTEFAAIMKENSKKDYINFAQKYKLDDSTQAHFTLNDGSDIGKTILDISQEQKIDLIVSGAKGKSGIESVLMGSVSESLVEHDHTLPLLIVKEKNHVFNFWKDFYGIN